MAMTVIATTHTRHTNVEAADNASITLRPYGRLSTCLPAIGTSTFHHGARDATRRRHGKDEEEHAMEGPAPRTIRTTKYQQRGEKKGENTRRGWSGFFFQPRAVRNAGRYENRVVYGTGGRGRRDSPGGHEGWRPTPRPEGTPTRPGVTGRTASPTPGAHAPVSAVRAWRCPRSPPRGRACRPGG